MVSWVEFLLATLDKIKNEILNELNKKINYYYLRIKKIR